MRRNRRFNYTGQEMLAVRREVLIEYRRVYEVYDRKWDTGRSM